MSLRLRLAIVLLLILGTGFFFSLRSVLYDLRPHYLATMEDALIDLAEILAAQVSNNSKGTLDTSVVSTAMKSVQQSSVDAQIYDKHKTSVDADVYICDENGRVVYSSTDDHVIGANYSRWNDVYLCLRGEYGARVSNTVEGDASTAVLYIAAPIYDKERIIGTLTVSKPSDSVSIFVQSGRKHILIVTIMSAVIIFLLIILLGFWVTRPIHQLEQFVRQTASGAHPDRLAFAAPELQNVAEAISEMRNGLDGKQYIETYIQQLTHEFKSPLSVISGAGELLQEDMPEEQRLHFINNILAESERMKELVDRILLLASVENYDEQVQNDLDNVAILPLLHALIPMMQVLADEREVTIECEGDQDDKGVRADPFLLELAVRNVILNAIQFSPRAELVIVRCTSTDHAVEISCIDRGSGIPEYARDKVCERFYSLPRPDAQRKSSGLGLSLVQAVMHIYNGKLIISHGDNGVGTSVVLSFPHS